MKYINLSSPNQRAGFREAVVSGQPSGGGLYFPEALPNLRQPFLDARRLGLQEIAQEVIPLYSGNEIPHTDLQKIIDASFDLLLPIFPAGKDRFMLELFHGPTLAFKDFGIRFLAALLQHFHRNQSREINVLTATSGDTGGAVAHAFGRKQGIRAIILYPDGKVSEFQERQIGSIGGNIIAVKIDGSFDDCQNLVKSAFADAALKAELRLTSANSINIGRLVPQIIYYLYASSWMPVRQRLLFSVPSGNFGNLCAGLMAGEMGMESRFIAATNANDVVPEFFRSGIYHPRPSAPTLSNAMDVGNPNNFARILHLFGHDRNAMQKKIRAFSVSDATTLSTIRKVMDRHGYLLDPHSAVAWAALDEFRIAHPEDPDAGIVVSTAHPAKFGEELKKQAGIETQLPYAHRELLKKEKSAFSMKADLPLFKQFLREISSGAVSLRGEAALSG